LNRNKRGIVLDFTNPAACDVARELIARADVVVENFSAGVMRKYGLDYPSVAPSNPRLVYCSISAYGRQGPFASRPGRSDHAGRKRVHVAQRFRTGRRVRTGRLRSTW
jgi:formyl-CoA transferase